MIRTVELVGGPTEMGRDHGSSMSKEIPSYLAQRMRLAGDGSWVGERMGRDRILEEMELSVAAHERFDPDLLAECEAMAIAAGISVPEALLLGGFTDAVDLLRTRVVEDDCTAILMPPDDTHGAILAQTWDMHDTAVDYIIMLHLRPDTGPPALVFTTAGCLGQMGMNAAGVCIGINNLTANEGANGVSWPFVVRAALRMSTASDVVDLITGADLMGGHNYMVVDATGDGYNIEAMPQATVVDKVRGQHLAHTNHCLHATTKSYESVMPTDSMKSSRARYERTMDLLEPESTSVAGAMELLRDEPLICVRSTPPRNIETCGAVVMNPKDGVLYAVRGIPSEHEFDRLTL